MDAETDAYLMKVRGMIAEHGWIVQGVGAGEGSPSFHYTVGLWPSAGFEIFTIGLPPDVGQIILNVLARRVLDGLRFTNGMVMDDVLGGYDAMMIEVSETGGFMGVANRLYRLEDGVNIPAWQMVYPDVKHRWPWDEDSGVATVPVLGHIPTPQTKRSTDE